MRGAPIDLPPGYYLEKDPDILVLRRLDGSMVAAFSTRGAAPDAIRQTLDETVRRESSPQRRTVAPVEPDISLRARFFGHFDLLCDGEALSLGRNGKALAILKYLLANRSRTVSQDHLMGWLWPDSNLRKARWSLNSAIHGLRKLLGGCTRSSVNYVLLEEGHYRLCPTVRVSTDVDEFDARYERGRLLEKMGGMDQAAAGYEAAVALYRDDYLVEDLYEDWTMVERERLSNAYMDALGRLADHYMETGRHQECIGACYRVLEKDRCHEESYRLLMRCYVRLGMRGRAIRQYRLCEEILYREYGLVPASETRDLYENFLQGQSA